MDIVRRTEPHRRRRRVLSVVAVFVAVAAALFAASRLRPAAPVVERGSVWLDAVERGPMLRQLRGHGTLQPEAVRWIAAPTVGTVDVIHVEPGARVAAGDVLVELGNPEVRQRAADAESALRRARAEYESLQLDLANQRLDTEAEAASVEAEFVAASLEAESNRELADKGLVSSIQLKRSEAVAEAMRERRKIARQRIEMAEDVAGARLAAKRAEVEQQEALAGLRREQLAALYVRAGLDGVVQEVPAEIGQQVAPGTNLARVAGLGRLQAELKVAANLAGELRPGLSVRVDTRNGFVSGELVRIDPAVRQGTVTVDVRLLGELPAGARPDLAVDGAIELERLTDVLHVARPVRAEEGCQMDVFRLELDGAHASKVTVSFGRASVDSIEVRSGLEEGEQIIVSDMVRWDRYQRVKLR